MVGVVRPIPLLLLLACVAPSAARPVAAPATKPPPEVAHRSDLLAELAWARTASLVRVEEERGSSERDARALARAVAASSGEGEDAMRALLVVSESAMERGEIERADRALRAIVCRELATDPPLDGALPALPPTDPWDRCTARTRDGAILASAWRLLGRTYWLLVGEPLVATAAYERATRHSIEGTPEHARTSYEAGLLSEGQGERAEALRHYGSAVLSPDSSYVGHALMRLCILLVDDDWNLDGRKDRRSGVGRPEVVRWLAARPSGAARALDVALEDHLGMRRCAEARRILAILPDLPGGSEVVARRRGEVAACNRGP
jgi:hypothetical protein